MSVVCVVDISIVCVCVCVCAPQFVSELPFEIPSASAVPLSIHGRSGSGVWSSLLTVLRLNFSYILGGGGGSLKGIFGGSLNFIALRGFSLWGFWKGQGFPFSGWKAPQDSLVIVVSASLLAGGLYSADAL